MSTNMEKWLAALRSGEFKQTSGTLGRVRANTLAEREHCCLGVACEMAELPSRETDLRDGARVAYQSPKGSFISLPPLDVALWLGLEIPSWFESEEFNLRLDAPREYQDRPGYALGEYTAAEMNDGGFTFEQIADLIQYFGVEIH